MMKIETTILKNLLQNEDYARKVLPFLNDEYFTENSDKIIYNQINNFILKYAKKNHNIRKWWTRGFKIC